MKLFTVDEANALLPVARRLALKIQSTHRRMLSLKSAAQHAAEGAEQGGGGMPGSASYVSVLLSLAEYAGQLEALGVQMKDYARGLIDFPSLREGRVVLLCWQLGEGDRIEWWHDTESGFAGRQPLMD